MDIILVHIGPQIPPYLFYCIKQIRNVCDNRIILCLSERQEFALTSDNTITIYLDSIPKCKTWKEFNPDFFKDMGLPLWRYACERFFAIESVMEHLGIDKALHIENDNLIYAKPDEEFLDSWCKDYIGVTQITDTLLGAGVMYISRRIALNMLNYAMNCLIARGSIKIMDQYGTEMLNEQRLLKILKDEQPFLINILPIFPIDESKYVYDCASWGQFVGGTFFEPGVSYHDNSHLIGREINYGKYLIKWPAVCVDDSRRKKKIPCVLDRTTDKTYPLFNLHIHSKQLEKWMSK